MGKWGGEAGPGTDKSDWGARCGGWAGFEGGVGLLVGRPKGPRRVARNGLPWVGRQEWVARVGGCHRLVETILREILHRCKNTQTIIYPTGWARVETEKVYMFRCLHVFRPLKQVIFLTSNFIFSKQVNIT